MKHEGIVGRGAEGIGSIHQNTNNYLLATVGLKDWQEDKRELELRHWFHPQSLSVKEPQSLTEAYI